MGQAPTVGPDVLQLPEADEKGGKGGSGGEPPEIDPIIQGLLARLPKSGDVWPEAERKLWLELLAGSFRLIYRDAGMPAGPIPDRLHGREKGKVAEALATTPKDDEAAN